MLNFKEVFKCLGLRDQNMVFKCLGLRECGKWSCKIEFWLFLSQKKKTKIELFFLFCKSQQECAEYG